MVAELNKTYKTKGGWDAQVIWVAANNLACYAIHKPQTAQESVPVAHDKTSGRAVPAFVVAGPPTYEEHHPADLILE